MDTNPSRERELRFARDMQELMPKRAAPGTAVKPPPPPPPEPAELQAMRREVFAATYAATGRPKEAAAVAGYSPASNTVNQLTHHPEVRQRVREINEEKLAAAGITAQRVMQEIARIAFFDIRKLYNENGDLKPISELDDDTAAAISSVDSELRIQGKGDEAIPVITKKIRTHSKGDSLNLLSKYFKIVGDEGDGMNALASALADRLDRAHRRMNAVQPVEDAVLIEPEQVSYDPPVAYEPVNQEKPREDDQDDYQLG